MTPEHPRCNPVVWERIFWTPAVQEAQRDYERALKYYETLHHEQAAASAALGVDATEDGAAIPASVRAEFGPRFRAVEEEMEETTRAWADAIEAAAIRKYMPQLGIDHALLMRLQRTADEPADG